jgi:hypothetical protein
MAISRRALFAGAAAAFGLRSACRPAGAADAQKIKKTDAKYQDRPNGQQRCEICLQFVPPGSCKIVEGPVTPHSWCQLFAAKENAH